MYDKRARYRAINILLQDVPWRGRADIRVRRRGQGGNALVRRPPLNLKFLVVARIKLTLQQATTCSPSHRVPARHLPASHPFSAALLPRDDAILHAHILHLITFLKYEPPDTNVGPLRLRHSYLATRRDVRWSSFYMQNFTGRGSETAICLPNELYCEK